MPIVFMLPNGAQLIDKMRSYNRLAEKGQQFGPNLHFKVTVGRISSIQMIAAAENHGSDTSNGDAIAADDTGVDIGSALLGAPFESFRVEPEIPKELGIFQRLKSLLVQPATGPAKSPEADIVVTDINPQSDQTDVEEDKVAKEAALSDQDIQEEFDKVQDGQFDGEFISFSDEEDGIARHHLQELRSFGEDNADNKKSAATPSDRNEWRKNLSKRQIRDRFEEIINQLTVIKQKPVWFDSRKRLPGQIGGYRGDSLAKM
jgi:hypothetical protein